jgi:nicotinamidase-related amidase
MHPNDTALILVGYQNDYFAKNGVLRGVNEDPKRVDEILSNTLSFIREAGPALTVISTPIVLEPTFRIMANSEGILEAIKKSGAFKAGTSGADTIPELLAMGDRITYVHGKMGFNAFSNTELDGTLRAKNIKNVLVAGMLTSLCIDSTGRAAYERGYGVTILTDCCAGRSPAEQDFFCSTVFPLYAGLLDSQQALQKLTSAAA